MRANFAVRSFMRSGTIGN